MSAAATERMLKQAKILEAELRGATPSSWMPLLRPALQRIVIGEERIRLHIARSALHEILSPADDREGPRIFSHDDDERAQHPYEYVIPVRIRTRGAVLRLVVGGDAGSRTAGPDAALCKTIARAYEWAERLISGRDDSVRAIAKAEGVTESYVTRVLRLAFLAPAIAEAILDGRHPVELTADQLTLREDVPWAWGEQRLQLGFDPAKERY